MRKKLRAGSRVGSLLLVVLLGAQSLPAVAREVHRFEVPSHDASAAIREFGVQSGLQILAAGDSLRGKQLNPVTGELSTEDGLNVLLAGSGLTHRYVGERAVALVDETAPAPAPVRGNAPSGAGDRRTSWWSRLRLARAEPGQIPSDARSAPSAEPEPARIEEIIVTAQKRSERLQDVPSSITAIGGDRLEALQVKSLTDLASYVPGLTVASSGVPGRSTIQIRGIGTGSADFAGPLVAMYIDDLPVGASTAASRANTNQVDLMPYDLERIEVLKGPQGTLYGANAMGGLIKYALRQPDPLRFDARAGVMMQQIDGSSGVDWGLRAAVNLPLVEDKLALRVSGFHQDNAGFIDNVATGDEDDNHSTHYGGRAALSWQATENLALRANFLAQNLDAHNLTNVILDGVTMKPFYGDDTTYSNLPFSTDNQVRHYSLNLDWDLGSARLSSVAGWSRHESFSQNDYTIPYASFAQFLDPDAAFSLYKIQLHTDKFISETRLASVGGKRFEWMLGGYFTKEDAGEEDTWPSFTADYVLLPHADLYQSHSGYTYKEAAAFANATYKLTERFDVGGGVRYGRYEQTGCGTVAGFFFNNTTVVTCQDPPRANVTNWMATARFHLDADSMLYARVATGYRPGTPNIPFAVQFGAPPQSDPDKTTNYELGFKGALLDRRMQIEAAIFRVDWDELQLQLERFSPAANANILFLTNISSAVSQGAEVSVAYLVTPDLRIDTTFAYTDAHLTADIPPVGVIARDGDTLPLAPRFAASLAADYARPLDGRKTLLLGGAYRYRDEIFNQFTPANLSSAPPSNPRARIGSWSLFDAHAGIATDQLTLKLYVTNLFDKRALVGTYFFNDPNKPMFIPVQPRTIGLSMDHQF